MIRTTKSLSNLLTCAISVYILTASYGALVSASISNSGYGSQPQGASRRIESSRPRGLDKVLNRLDGGSVASNYAKTVPNSQSPGSPSSASLDSVFKHLNVRQEDATILPQAKEFDTLDDDDDLDDEDSYEDEEDDTTAHNDVLADKMSWGYQYRNRYLASKTTTTTTTTTTTPPPPPPPVMSYSQYKWQTFGTRQGVEQSRRQAYLGGSNPNKSPNYHGNSHGGTGGHHNPRHHSHGHNGQHHNHQNGNNHHQYGQQLHGNYNRAQPQTPDTSIREAISHALRVSKEGTCKIPKPRVVRVQDFYPHPGKSYVPHCTILHQCTDDAGCCKHDVLTCSPKTTQRVELSFYTITVDNTRGSSVERLVFYNHTECECRDKLDEMMPRDVSYPDVSSLPTMEASLSHNNPDPVGLERNTLGNTFEYSKSKGALRCKCPSTFTERVLTDGSCSCDCFDKQQDCLRQKRGRDFFSMQDKWCIQSGRCEVPGCSYGSYIHLVGRCPRKKEKLGPTLSWHRYLTQ